MPPRMLQQLTSAQASQLLLKRRRRSNRVSSAPPCRAPLLLRCPTTPFALFGAPSKLRRHHCELYLLYSSFWRRSLGDFMELAYLISSMYKRVHPATKATSAMSHRVKLYQEDVLAIVLAVFALSCVRACTARCCYSLLDRRRGVVRSAHGEAMLQARAIDRDAGRRRALMLMLFVMSDHVKCGPPDFLQYAAVSPAPCASLLTWTHRALISFDVLPLLYSCRPLSMSASAFAGSQANYYGMKYIGACSSAPLCSLAQCSSTAAQSSRANVNSDETTFWKGPSDFLFWPVFFWNEAEA